jgi:hypothetical protein
MHGPMNVKLNTIIQTMYGMENFKIILYSNLRNFTSESLGLCP